jgi:two-component system sensor histidine kinase DegS
VSLPIAWNDNLYGLIMESLNNATKHASAKHLWVHFGCNQGLLVVSIKDDGCGFDLQEALVRGMGIQNMRERAELMGGRLEINSTLGAGTEISLWVEPKLELERKQEK